MIIYPELTQEQQQLVDTYIALNVAQLVGMSNDLPSFICDREYVEASREKYSGLVLELEEIRADISMRARERGINPDNPKEYIQRAITIIQKMNILSGNNTPPSPFNKTELPRAAAS
jgi:hypothetical protein